MKVRFTKMHGAGNDFVVIDNVRQNLDLSASQIRRLANRQRGIGCDQVLIVGPPDSPDADFRYHIFNADGSEAGQCGNGARCLVLRRVSAATVLGVLPALYESSDCL